MLYVLYYSTFLRLHIQATGYRAQILSDQELVGASAFLGASDPYSCVELCTDGKNKFAKNLEIESVESRVSSID